MAKLTGKIRFKGGPGSGFHDHAGRPGKVGGSAPEGGGPNSSSSRTGRSGSSKKKPMSLLAKKVRDSKAIARKAVPRAKTYKAMKETLDEWSKRREEYGINDGSGREILKYSSISTQINGGKMFVSFHIKHPSDEGEAVAVAKKQLSFAWNQARGGTRDEHASWKRWVTNVSFGQAGDYKNDWVEVQFEFDNTKFQNKPNPLLYMDRFDIRDMVSGKLKEPDWYDPSVFGPMP